MAATEKTIFEQEIIPTLSKSKISRLLSYPIGAELLSQALRQIPQFQFLKLHFYAAMGNGLQDCRLGGKTIYEFLRVEYLNSSAVAEKYPIRPLYSRPPQYRWEIIILPVPRVHRHAVNRHIVEVVLPKVERWLCKRASQISVGSEVLSFFYDPEEDAVSTEEVSRMEPLL